MIQQSPTERAREVLARYSLPVLMNGVAPVVHVDAAIRAMIEFASQAAQPAEADGVERITRDALAEVMQDAWGEICDDSGSHPLDMKHGRGSILFYEPGHWTDLIALRLNERRAATPKAPTSTAGEVERLTHVIDRDRYAAAACVGAIEHVLHTRRWLREAGRGSYAYDDERYQEEFGLAFDEIQEALRPMRALSKDKTDCTRDEDKVKAARAAGAKKFAALATPPAPNDDLRAALTATCDAEIAKYTGTYRSDDDIRFALNTMRTAVLAALKENRRG